MPELARTTRNSAEPAAALADLVRALAATTSPAEMGRQTAAALRRAFPQASSVLVHEWKWEGGAPLSLLEGLDPLQASAEAVAALQRAVLEKMPLVLALAGPSDGGGSRIAVAPVTHGNQVLGTVALLLPSDSGWSDEE